MARQATDDVIESISSGSFLTTDTFRRTAEPVSNKLHEAGWSINLGTSSDRPTYLVEDIDIADGDEYEDATSVDFAEVRRSSTWNAMAALMAANDQRFIVEDDEGDQIVAIRIHPDFDRAEIRRMTLKRKTTARDRRIENIEKLVRSIAEKLDVDV